MQHRASGPPANKYIKYIGVYYESESIAVLQGTGAGRTLYEGGTDAVDYAAVFKPCNLTA